MLYSQINLDNNLAKGIDEAGYVNCTPVQEKVLKVSLDGSDLYVQSQTGSGKTAAFLITIMEQLLKKSDEKKSALILVPTRELAVQVEEEAKKIGKYTLLKSFSFYGGVGYEEQVEAVKKGVDLLIGTPGRIIDLVESKKLSLSNVFYLAIDEADRMFDMGFYPDLRKILKFLPETAVRQTMLFSATLNSYVKNLAWEYTKDAKEITIESQNITVDEIDQELIHVSSDDKISLLLGILDKEKPESLIIFCNTKKMCQILSKRLTINGIKNEYIIGDLPQSKRLKIMERFKTDKISCLIATDVAARGIDVNDLAMVINFDLPTEAENYVHRIGRTARAGKSGKAYTLCSEQDVYSLMAVERYIEKQIPSRVATSDELTEDKSKNVYIRLDGDKEKRNQFKKHESKSDSKNKKDFIKFKGNSAKKTIRRASEDEIQKLSNMSTDDRIEYFKEKYAKSNDINYKNNYSKKRSCLKNKKSFSKNKTNDKPPKKIGLLSRLKSLIGRNK